MSTLKQQIIELVKEHSESKSYLDEGEFLPYEASGGNYDDAFWLGHDAGVIELARTIMDHLNKIEDEVLLG